jgi:hypothetical protein
MENVEIIYVWTLNRVVEELPSSCPQDFWIYLGHMWLNNNSLT